MRKREMTIAGIPLQPIRRGKPAVIREANGCRQTTPVLWVDQLSSTEVTFETQNTVYHLRVMAVLRGKEAHRHEEHPAPCEALFGRMAAA